MIVDSNTYFNLKDIDNVQFFGDIFLGYPSFSNVEIVGATYNKLDMNYHELEILNNDRALVQAIALDYLASIVDLDNIG